MTEETGQMKQTLGVTGLTSNAMALIAPGAFLWLTFFLQATEGTGTANTGVTGKVASAGVPTAIESSAPVKQMAAAPAMTSIEVLSKPPVQYTSEARQLHIEGDVVLRVTFTAAGQVVVEGVTRGLGHGLDEEARRVAQQIRFRPATRNGQAVDSTTTIRITFQLA